MGVLICGKSSGHRIGIALYKYCDLTGYAKILDDWVADRHSVGYRFDRHGAVGRALGQKNGANLARCLSGAARFLRLAAMRSVRFQWCGCWVGCAAFVASVPAKETVKAAAAGAR